MKRIIALMSAMAVALSMTACGSTSKSDETSIETTAAEVQEISRPYGEMRGLAAWELIAEMKTGWNLGNTMDAKGGETAWGNPVTTKEMIDAVHAQGFDTIRIPTTWDGHMSAEGTYTVDEEWMNRVEEIVDYALENEMYVILNTHHETEWIRPVNDGLDDVKARFSALWLQIAEKFEPYGDHLIFEGMNEPRIEGGPNEWNGGTEENRNCINELNELFVNTVRSTGGNNEKRILLITTVAAASCDIAITALTVPDDKYVGISLHAYTPYRFTYDNSKESWDAKEFNDSVASDIDKVFDDIDEVFTSKGIPVIITEYGAVKKIIDKDWYLYNNDHVAAWADYYLRRAKTQNIPCVWWDNGIHSGNGELFSIFDRNGLVWYEPEVADAIVNAVK